MLLPRPPRRLAVAAIALLALAGGPGCAAEGADGPLRPEINDRYLDPDLEPAEWVERFETESREIYRERAAIVSAVDLKPGDRVADVGAGTGLFVPLFAREVGDAGRVYAVDISPRLLDHLRERAAAEGLSQVRVVEGSERSIELAEDSVDVVFTCDTYHHFSHPEDSLASIRRALRSGGRLVVVDFHRIPGVSPDWLIEHVRAGQATFRAEIEAAGFLFEREVEIEGLEENYMLLFRLPEAS